MNWRTWLLSAGPELKTGLFGGLWLYCSRLSKVVSVQFNQPFLWLHSGELIYLQTISLKIFNRQSCP